MKFQYNDGGRKNAGYKGATGDCFVRAVAIATGLPYRKVYDAVNTIAKQTPCRGKLSSARKGVYKQTAHLYLSRLGWKWTPTMGVGTGCRVHLKDEELPEGRLVVSVSKHYVAVIDGVIHDTANCSRNGNRCVYGYWKETENVSQ